MLKNYIVVALRALRRQPGFAAVNIVGLALALALCVLIYQYVLDEAGFDAFHANGDRIVRVVAETYTDGGETENASALTPMVMGPTFAAEMPDVEASVRFRQSRILTRRGLEDDGEAQDRTVLFADPSLFDVFSFDLEAGDAETALSRPDGVVLSAETAAELFGESNAMGETLEIRTREGYQTVTVVGVTAPVPANSSISFDILAPLTSASVYQPSVVDLEDDWNKSSLFTYALLRPGADLEAASRAATSVRATRMGDGNQASSSGVRFQPLAEVHRDVRVENGMTPPSNPRYSLVLAGIAIAVLLIACINFVTLALSRTVRRGREVGVRKAIGADRGQIARQFMAEASLLCATAFAVGLGVSHLSLPMFNEMVGKSLEIVYDVPSLAAFAVLFVAATLGAGGYPALLLARLSPVMALRARRTVNTSGRLSQTLVVAQFALTIVFVVGAIGMARQMSYIQTKSLGYNHEQLVSIHTGGLDGALVLERLRNQLDSRADVRGLTGVDMMFTSGQSVFGWSHEERTIRAQAYTVDPQFLDVLEIEVADGRGFEAGRLADQDDAVVINQALAREYGWTDPIGQTLDGLNPDEPRTVIGVVEDFHFRSLHEPIEPVMMRVRSAWPMDYVLVRLAPGDIPTSLDAVKTAWASAAPDIPFDYTFVDDALGRQYRAEQRWSQVVNASAGLAILIACFGLIGLVAFTVEQRRKEVGIRKSIGATDVQLTVLLSRDFLRLVLVGFVIAAPIAAVAMRRWLEAFEYRVDIGATPFVIAGALLLGIVALTVGAQAARAATADPVRALRSD